MAAGADTRAGIWGRRLRSFAGQVAIIVLGVLIALAADKVVGDIRDRDAAADARANVRAELAENLGRIAQRHATRACIDRRLGEIADLLDGRRRQPIRWVGRPQVWPVENSRWTTVAEGGRATLLRPDEQAAFGAIYANILDFRDNQATEQLAWAQLRALAGRAVPSAQEAATARAALQTARYTAWLIQVNAEQATRDAARLGIQPHTDWTGSRSVCIASDTPPAEAERQAGRTLGIAEPL
jgi:hypothetical protein